MLEADNLECVRGDRSLFRDLSFRVDGGQCLLVSGLNGSGKTSLLRILCGLLAPMHGTVRWRGQPIRALGDAYRSELSYLGHLSAVKEELSAAENVEVASALAGRSVPAQAARSALAEAGLRRREDLPVRVLSQGQKRRVALARLLLGGSTLWLLDEPVTALDADAVKWLAGEIDRHVARGGVAVLTSHQDLPLATAPLQTLRLRA
ncbi:MAG: cytochrome c biogenesis heme-transporting ATPase CcmA [Betaproteobacteria bacterium]|nr:cytochrome c biogenesis heme-transporting ATPase CcmA [Betaproteobacteria bacterium]